MLCKNCRQPLPYLAPATVTHCENCLLDISFPGKTAIDLHLVGTMPKRVWTNPAQDHSPPKSLDEIAPMAADKAADPAADTAADAWGSEVPNLVINLPAPNIDASDTRIAAALGMSVSTVYIARVYNPDTYAFLLDMEARKIARIAPFPAQPAKLEPKQKKGGLGISEWLFFAAMTFIVCKLIFG